MSGPGITVQVGRKWRPRQPLVVTILIVVPVLLFVSVMSTVIVTIGIWPGEMKLTAPLLCPETRPDAFVVSDTYSAQPGETSTTFTMYCVGERGDVEDKGWAIPMGLLTLAHGAIILALGLFAVIVGKLVAAFHRSAGPPDNDVGPAKLIP